MRLLTLQSTALHLSHVVHLLTLYLLLKVLVLLLILHPQVHVTFIEGAELLTIALRLVASLSPLVQVVLQVLLVLLALYGQLLHRLLVVQWKSLLTHVI